MKICDKCTTQSAKTILLKLDDVIDKDPLPKHINFSHYGDSLMFNPNKDCSNYPECNFYMDLCDTCKQLLVHDLVGIKKKWIFNHE